MTNTRDETHKVLAQADALMRRHRVFVAGATQSPPFDESLESHDDLPILTEIVVETDLPQGGHARVPDNRRRETAEIVSTALIEWLDEDLPQAVLNVMDGLSDQIIAAVTERAKTDLLQRLEDRLGKASGT